MTTTGAGAGTLAGGEAGPPGPGVGASGAGTGTLADSGSGVGASPGDKEGVSAGGTPDPTTGVKGTNFNCCSPKL